MAQRITFPPRPGALAGGSLPFQVQLFHPGLYYDRTVQVNVVDADGVHLLPFSPELLRLRQERLRRPASRATSATRASASTTRSSTPEYSRRVIVFLGASYFRALGRDNVYGLSARGLADRHGRAGRARSSRASSSSGW